MLVPHEPKLDPRVGWVIDLCRKIGRTEVIAATWTTDEPAKEYDGTISIDRVGVSTTAAPRAHRLLAVANRVGSHPSAHEFAERQGVLTPGASASARWRHRAGGIRRWFANWASYSLLVSALYRRARVVGVPPTVVVAHDIYGLIPAALLKRRWGAALVYDSHEYAAQGDLIAPRWQERLTRMVERYFIKRADRVITVSPPLARQLERDYRLSGVVSVPNTEPARAARHDLALHAERGEVRFLLQGQAAPGRGFERLFELWQGLDDPRALLQVRCPDGAYPEELRTRFAALFDSGRAVWLDAVPTTDLVSAASEADVGVIPYLGPNRNHVYACPNKLSQYMAAGLAILSTDLEFIASVLAQYRCGVVYQPANAASFREAIATLVDDPAALVELRRNALQAARDEFNWERVSVAYATVVEDLFSRGRVR